MAVRPEQRDVILIAQPAANSKNSSVCIAAAGLDPPRQLKGPYTRSRTGIVSSLAVLPGHETFAVGESCILAVLLQGSHATRPVKDCASSLEIVFPVRQFGPHAKDTKMHSTAA